MHGEDGHDTLDGGEGSDSIYGNSGDDLLAGGLGDDTVPGETGNDQVGGGAGRDRLTGGDGQDTLVGGLGVDTLSGDAGADLFVFASGEGEALPRMADRILDFVQGEDRIGLKGGLAFADLIIEDGKNWIGGTASEPDTVVFIADTHEVAVILQDVGGLTASDFLIL